jgi:organic hydroperoxide reductase OsmC/OhrA
MTSIGKLLYTARVHTADGRNGASRSPNGDLAFKLSTPGTAYAGTNPEQ